MAGHVAVGRRTTAHASRQRTLDTAGRVGLLTRGATYVIVGVLAVRIAFGDGSQQADRAGALRTVADTPFGTVLLWLLGAGFVCMALWRLGVAAFGGQGSEHPGRTRLAALARGVFYSVVAGSTTAFVAAGEQPSSSDSRSKTLTARVMEHTGGRWLVGAVGAGLALAGVVVAVRALAKKYLTHLRTAEMSRTSERAVRFLGTVGGTARGVVFALAGVFVLRAAVEFDPREAKGVDDTLRSVAGTALGPWLLVAVALGLVCFGACSAAESRWRRV